MFIVLFFLYWQTNIPKISYPYRIIPKKRVRYCIVLVSVKTIFKKNQVNQYFIFADISVIYCAIFGELLMVVVASGTKHIPPKNRDRLFDFFLY